MYEGNSAILEMTKILYENAKWDDKLYYCDVLKYEKDSEDIFLLLENDRLQDILLGAEYECKIQDGENKVSCKGIVKERYLSEIGNVLHFHILGGFYEINIK